MVSGAESALNSSPAPHFLHSSSSPFLRVCPSVFSASWIKAGELNLPAILEFSAADSPSAAIHSFSEAVLTQRAGTDSLSEDIGSKRVGVLSQRRLGLSF